MKFLKNIAKAGIKKRKNTSIQRDSRGQPKSLLDRKLTEEEKMLVAGTGLAGAATYPASKMLMDQDRRGKDARNKRYRDSQNLEPGNSNSRRARQEGK